MSQVWRISLSNLSRNLLEATELANVLQEVSSSIQVTGLSTSLSGRISTSTSGTPTKLSARERIRSAVPVNVGAGAVPWEQLVGVVSSDDVLHDAGDLADAADRQPQMLQVNTGGAVFFLFFKLSRKQQQQYQQQLSLRQPARAGSGASSSATSATVGVQVAAQQLVEAAAGAAAAFGGAAAPAQQRKLSHPREGIAVLKIGFNRLAMQAEQFANELTRHLGIAAPECRIVRQVGSTADEWTAALGAVHCLAGCRCGSPPSNTPATCPGSTSSSYGGAGSPAANTAAGSKQVPVLSEAAAAAAAAASPAGSGGRPLGISAAGSRCSSCGGCLPAASLAGQQAATAPAGGGGGSSSGSGSSSSSGPGELLSELSHLPCFLLMEFVEGERLSDSPHALQGCAVGQLMEDVGCLFLLDMLLGNADRMPCADLGWRGNANNLLYGAPGTRHESRPVAIDSCVARRPPALKASAEDAAVERLAQLLLSVPDVSCSLLQQLLANVERGRGQCSRLSLDGAAVSDTVVALRNSRCAEQSAADGSRLGDSGCSMGSAPAAAAGDAGGGDAGNSQSPALQRGIRGGTTGSAAGAAAGLLALSDADIARFQAGLKKCLTGVLQIKGLLEMVSTKIAESIAEFVADVVRLNPTLLPSPAAAGGPTAPGGGLAAAGAGLLRSPRPSPRPSLRSMHAQASGSGGGSATPQQQQQQQQQQQGTCPPLPPPMFAAAGGGVNASTDSNNSSGGSGSGSTPGAGDGTPPCSAAGISHAAAAAGVPSPPVHLFSSRGNSSSRSPSPALVSAAFGAATDDAAAGSGSTTSSGGCIPRSPDRSLSSSRCSSAEPPLPGCPAGTAAALVNDTPSPASDVARGSSPVQSVGIKFFKQLSSPVSKALPLARRAVSHLGFASIKAAVCSTDPAAAAEHTATSTATTASLLGGGAASNAPLVPAVDVNNSGSSSMTESTADVATAVAAALSPRATEAQTQALADVFGGGSLTGAAAAAAAGVGRPTCAKRMSWGSQDEHSSSQAPSKLSPPDHFPSAPGDERSPTTAPSSRRIASCIVPATFTPPAAGYSPQRSSHGSLGHAQQQQQQQQQQGPNLAKHTSFAVHQALAPAAGGSTTAAGGSSVHSSSSSLQVLAAIQLDATLASIKQEARHDGALAERLAHWTAVFRERGAELSEAIASWQARHHLAAVLSTGFLDGSHPIVDAYELGVRLQHMLRRLAALAAGAMVQAPFCVLPGLWLGNAVAADSHHLLQYLGVTHVVNAAQELPLESAPGLFQVYRVAIRDEEEEDVAGHFQQVQAWTDAALGGGGGVLVHCHEAKSRSVALLLAYLMISKGHTLATALAHIRSVRPEACPNAGFMVQLIALDRQLHGAASLSRADLPRAKPEARTCSICGAAAGLSYASLVRHMKTKHKAAGAATAAAGRARGTAVVAVASGKAAVAVGFPPLVN